MKLLISAASGLAALALATSAYAQTAPAAPPAPAAPAVSVSAKARPAIVALQQAVNAGNTAQIPALLQAAQTAAQTKEDRWFIARLQLKAAAAANDYAGMAAGLDAVAATGVSPPAELSDYYHDVANKLYNAKQYAQAAVLFDKASKLNPSDTELQTLVGQSYLLGGQKAQALAIAQKLIATDTAAGRKPPEGAYRLGVQAAFDAKSPQVDELAQQWLSAYPSADAWRSNLAIYASSAPLDDNGALALHRLMGVTGGLQATDYESYLKDLMDDSNFNEAHAVLDEAIAANALSATSPIAASVKSKPTASAADLLAAAKTAQSGMAVLKIGDRLYGMADYAKAADLYRQAKAKGVDASTANLFTGVALARAGDKAGAKAALSAVTGPHEGLAKYWLLYLDQHS